MKFMMQILPTVPATAEERERMRPIAHSTERVQQMLDEMVELARLAEDLGYSAFTWSEHHFYTEGLEFGAGPIPHLVHLLGKTKRIKLGPVGFVLPTWDPVRLAEDVAWADQMSRGRVLVGLARGVFPRWVNVLGQRYGIEPGVVGEGAERHNREVFEELFRVLQACWKDEPFSFDGKYYKVPFPAGGHEWRPHEATRRYGAAGEVDEQGMLRKISVVPKPFQKPHPDLFMALTTNEETIRWSAREGVTPIIFLPFPDLAIQGASFYQEEAAKAGRTLAKGESVGLARFAYVDKTRDLALETARNGSIFLYRQFHNKYYPQIPTTVEPLIGANMMFVGTRDDVREKLRMIRDQMNPEWMMILVDQGFLPFAEVKRQAEIFGAEVMPEFLG